MGKAVEERDELKASASSRLEESEAERRKAVREGQERSDEVSRATARAKRAEEEVSNLAYTRPALVLSCATSLFPAPKTLTPCTSPPM